MVAVTTFAQSGHFTELINGYDFMHHKAFYEGWSAYWLSGWMDMGTPMPQNVKGWAGAVYDAGARAIREQWQTSQRPAHFVVELLRQQHQFVLPAQSANMFW